VSTACRKLFLKAYSPAALLTLAVLAPTVLGGAAPSSTRQTQRPYTRHEIDSMLQALQADILAHLPRNSPQPDVPTKSEVDAKIAALDKQLGSLATSTQHWKNSISGDLTKISGRLDAAASDIGNLTPQVAALAAKTPSISPWWAIVISAAVSLCVAALGAFVSYRVVQKNQALTTAQRAQDRANSLIGQWEDKDSVIGQAFDALQDPAKFDQSKLDNLRRVGNFYDTIARAWRTREANPKMIEDHGLRNAAKEFWDALLRAQNALAQAGSTTFLDKFISNWNDLRAFVM
jgi:hypothetical protein